MVKKQPKLNARVAHRVDVAPGLMVLRVVPEGRDVPEFRPGQFAVLGLPETATRCAESDPDEAGQTGKMIRRAYSIASSCVERQYLEFYITLVRSGSLTPRLFALQPGDALWVGPKITGMFTLDQAPADRHILLVATGTGLAPYMSMLRTALADDRERRFVVVLGARHSWDLGYDAELLTMQRVCPNFAYLPIISRPSEEPVPWKGNVGYVTDLFKNASVQRALGHAITPETTRVFLCGNPSMIEDMCEHLGGFGFREHTRKEPGEIYVEKYW